MDLCRLEDLVGAVAVAVPPGEGLGGLAGGAAVHPLTGLQIPVVASATVTGLVNPALGPSHRQLCRELGLPLASAFNPDGEPIELRK
jgi:valyl-tRNA synthetase